VIYPDPYQLEGLTALLLCLNPRPFVLLNTIKEDLATLRVLDMLDTKVYTLLDEPVSDPLVDEDANRTRGDVVDDACSAVDAFSTHKHWDK